MKRALFVFLATVVAVAVSYGQVSSSEKFLTENELKRFIKDFNAIGK